MTALGLAGLVWCMIRAGKIRGIKDKDAQRVQLQTLVALNMASVGISGLGLAVVVVGLIL